MSGSEEDFEEFHINSQYAERYNRWREKEELQKCNVIHDLAAGLFSFIFKLEKGHVIER